MIYRVQGWADLGAGGRTLVYAEGNTFHAAKANLEHLYPTVINVGSAPGHQPTSHSSQASPVDKVFATAFPNTSPGVVFGFGSAAAAYFVADLLASRLTTNATVTTFIGLTAAVVCGLLGYVYARKLLIVCAAIVGGAIVAGLLMHLTAPGRNAAQPPSIPKASAIEACSDKRNSCWHPAVNEGRDLRKCDVSFDACMKTGRWTGPFTGKDYGPATQR